MSAAPSEDRLHGTVLPVAPPEAAAEIPSEALRTLWADANAGSFSISEAEFGRALAVAGAKYNAGLPPGVTPSSRQRLEFYRKLHLQELALACGCAHGRERAWQHFFDHYRAPLTQAAIGISGSSSQGEDLAGSLYGELFGLKERGGERRSPLEGYSGRGSLMGWLRATLAQRHVDNHRRTYRETPLEGKDFAARAAAAPPQPAALQHLSDAVGSALESLDGENRFLLASYFLDGRTQLELARLLRVHEATVSRRLKALTRDVRKRLLKDLQARGASRREAEEMLGTDPRDLSLNLRNKLQTSTSPPFSAETEKK